MYHSATSDGCHLFLWGLDHAFLSENLNLNMGHPGYGEKKQSKTGTQAYLTLF